MTTATNTKLNNRSAAIAFDVTQMTLRNWREGTKKRGPIPHKTNKAGEVEYLPSALVKWSEKHGVPIVVPFDKAVEQAQALQRKKGPKTSTAPSKENKANVGAIPAVEKAPAVKVKPAKKTPAVKKAKEAAVQAAA